MITFGETIPKRSNTWGHGVILHNLGGWAVGGCGWGWVLLAQIKKKKLQKCFLIGSSIRFQTDVTFEEKLYIITEV